MISIPVSIGELFDKITILEIKQENTKDPIKLQNIEKELFILCSFTSTFQISDQVTHLKTINQMLWNIEDEIRMKEKSNTFDDEFIRMARSIYKLNDKRAKIKREINIITNSEIIEEKIYQ